MATLNIFGTSTTIGNGIDAIMNPIGMGLDSLQHKDINPANYNLPTGRYVGLDDVLKRFHLGNEYGSESSNEVLTSGFDDPTYLSFKVEFGDWGYSLMNIEDIRNMLETSKINNTYLMDYDQFPMGLLNLDYIDFAKTVNWSNQTLYNAYNYLMNRNEDSRAAYIQTFTKGLYAIQKDMPYIFQKISGLDSLQQLHVKEGKRLKDAKITFECIEGIDMKIRTILEAYRKASVDDIWQRWILPDIYRYFKMIIYVFDRRLLLTGSGTYSTDQNNFPIMAFECSPCEIEIQPTIDSEYSIIYGEHKHAVTKFVVNVHNVKTYYSNALFNKLNTTVKTNWFSDLETKSEKQDVLSTDSYKNSNYRMRWMQRMFMINSEYNSFIKNNIHKAGSASDQKMIYDSYWVSDYYWPQDSWHYAIVSDSILDVRSWKDFKNYMKHLVTSRKVLIRDSRTANKDVFVNDLWTPDYYTYRYDARFYPVRLDIRRAQQLMASTIRHMIKKMLDGIYTIDSTPDITLIDPGLEFNLEHVFQTYIRPIIDDSKPVDQEMVEPYMNLSKQEQIINTSLIGGDHVHQEFIKPTMNLDKTELEYVYPDMNLSKIDLELIEPEMNLDKPNQEYVEPEMNLDKPELTYVEPIQNLSKKKQKYINPELNLDKIELELIEPEMNLDKLQQNYVEPVLNLDKIEQEYVEPILNIDKPNQEYVEPILNIDKPELNYIHPIINDDKPNQEYVEPILNIDKPNQEYVEPIMDISHNDMNMIEPIMNTSHINMNMIVPIIDIHNTSMNMIEPLDTSYHQGEMNFINPVITDDHIQMNFINPIMDIHKALMNMVEPIMDTSHINMNMVEPLDTSYHQGEMELVTPNDTSYHQPDQNMTNIIDTSYHMGMNMVEPVMNTSLPDMNMVTPVMNVSLPDMNMINQLDTSYHQGEMELVVPIITDEHQQFNQMTVPVINDSKASSDMIPLIGNTEKATMDMIPVLSETHKPEMDMMMLDTSVSLPDMDMTHLNTSTTLPEMDMTKLNVSTTLPEMDMTHLDMNTSIPNMDMLKVDTSVTLPDMKMIHPTMNTSLSEMNMTLLDTSVSLPDMNMTELNPNVSIPIIPMVEPTMNIDKHISPMVKPNESNDIPVTPMVEPNMNIGKHTYPMVKPNDYTYDVTMEMAKPNDEIKKDNISLMTKPNITEYDHKMKTSENIFENTLYNVSMNMTDNIHHPEKVTMDLVALPQDSSLATKIHMLTSLTEADVSKADIDQLLSLAEIIDTTVKQIKSVLGDMKMVDNKPNIPAHQHMLMVKIAQPARRLFVVDKLMKEVDEDALMRSLSNKKDRDNRDDYDGNGYTSQYRKGTAL